MESAVTVSVGISPPGLPAPGSLRAWLLAARLKTLPVGAAPVLVGSAAAHADGRFSLLPALAALLGALLIQIGTNFANDLFDFLKGADTADRVGPTRATQAGLLTTAQVRAGMIAAFAAAVLCGAYLVFVAGWPIVVVGVASILSGVAYTGGPWPLGYKGLGDLFVFVFFGLVAVTGTYFVQAGELSRLSFLTAVPVGFLATAVLVVNNIRDVRTDERAGKRTLPVRFGVGFGRAEYVALVTGALTWALVTAALSGRLFLALPLFLLPEAFAVCRKLLFIEPGPALNPLLGRTARLLLLFSIFQSVGFILG